MKKLGILACLVFGVLLTLEAQAMAGEPAASPKPAEPSGKNVTYSRMVFHNDSSSDCRIWIRPKGTPIPNTVKELDKLLISVPAHRQNRQTGRLKFGDYTCTTFYATDIQEFIDQPLTQELFDQGQRGQRDVRLTTPTYFDLHIQSGGSFRN